MARTTEFSTHTEEAVAHALLTPAPDESPEAYLARLKALHARTGALVEAIEQRRPALRPAAAVRETDAPAPAPAEARREPRLRLDASAAMWAVQVAAWVAIVLVVIVYGVD